jgi:hypothetical protein
LTIKGVLGQRREIETSIELESEGGK